MFTTFRFVRASTSRLPAAVRTYYSSGRQSQAAGASQPKPIAENPFASPEFRSLPLPTNSIGSTSNGTDDSDPHAWWKAESKKRNGDSRIISKFHGRSLEIKRPGEFAQQYRALKRLINQTGLRKEVRLQEYYEKPSERRVRVASENHRKRFAAVVSWLDKVEMAKAEDRRLEKKSSWSSYTGRDSKEHAICDGFGWLRQRCKGIHHACLWRL